MLPTRSEPTPKEPARPLAEVVALPIRVAEMTAIAERCARRLLVSSLSDEEILGYDEWGVPLGDGKRGRLRARA